MRISWLWPIKCLVLIQFIAATGCKHGQGAGSATAKRGAVDKKIPTHFAKPSGKTNYKGQLSSESYIVDPNGEIIKKDKKNCSLSFHDTEKSSTIQIQLDDYSDLLLVKSKIIKENFIAFKPLNEPFKKSYSTSNPTASIFGVLSSQGEPTITSHTYDRALYLHLDPSVKIEDITQDKLNEIKASLIQDRNFKSVSYIRDSFRFVIEGKRITRLKYINKRYVPGSAKDKIPETLENGDYNVDADMECIFSKN